jgi:site-specific recombinase XerD
VTWLQRRYRTSFHARNRSRSATETNRTKMAFLSTDEVLDVLKAARERSTRDWAMILLAYRHGLRASEVCGLKLTNIDLKAGSISITRLKGSLQTVQPLCPHRGQPLLDEMNALRAWLRERRSDGSDYLFTSQKGGRLDRTQFFRIFQTVAETAALPIEKRHPHVLKDSLASHLVAGNVNLALIRQALGHRRSDVPLEDAAGRFRCYLTASTSHVYVR